MVSSKLRHLHLPGLTPYEKASSIQHYLVDYHLKNRLGKYKVKQQLRCIAPEILTFQTPPTYTCGRREVGKLTTTQIQHLEAGGEAKFYEAQRGGQTTFHGPGQLTAYVICTLLCHDLNSKKFVHLLEQSVINTCRHYGIQGERTENPGVWTGNGDKIASLGVHLQRYISSHGIALNISPDLKWFDRIVACGLPEKKATSFEREGITGITVDDVAGTYAQCVSELMEGVKGVYQVKRKTDEEVRQMKIRRTRRWIEYMEEMQSAGEKSFESRLETARKELEQLINFEEGRDVEVVP